MASTKTNVKLNYKKSKKRAHKVTLVFNEEKRRDFLTGFHKRKLQRKKVAKDQLEKDLKEERRRLKAEAKESYKKLVVSHRPIPELENLISEEYEEEQVSVKVVELSTNDIARKNNWIGANRPKYDSNEGDDEEEKSSSEEVEEIPGVELKKKVIKSKEKAVEIRKFDSALQVKKVLKKQATKNVQKSKLFQTKHKIERQKQRKQSMHLKRQRSKFNEKRNKHRAGLKTKQ